MSTKVYHNDCPPVTEDGDDEEKTALMSKDIVYEINDDSGFLKDKMVIESSISSMSSSSVSSDRNFKVRTSGATKKQSPKAQISALC